MAQSQRAIDGGNIPGPKVVPNVVSVTMCFTLGNLKTARATFYGHYPSAAPPLQSAANALFTSLGTAFTSNLATLMHTTTSFTKVEVRDMASASNPVYVGTGTAVAGTGAGSALPAENAIVLTENVDVRGRGAKGRVYLSGWAGGAGSANGAVAAATQTALNQFGTAVMNALNAQGLSPAVAKPARQQYTGLTGTEHPSRGATYANVTSMICSNLSWDSQRRRGSK